MGRRRQKIADNPVSRRLYSVLQKGKGIEYNLKKLEEHGISRGVVNSWINGRRNPQIASLNRVSEILEIDVYSFLSDDQNKQNEQNEQDELLLEQSKVCDLVKKVNKKDVLEAAKTVLKIGMDVKI